MARPRNPKSKNPFGGLRLAPEKEIALKKMMSTTGLSLAYITRVALEKELKARGYLK